MINSSIYVWRLILISLFALAGLSPTHISAWKLEKGDLQPVKTALLPSKNLEVINPTQVEIAGELYCLRLTGKKVTLSTCDQDASGISWVSPKSWQVKQAFFSDLNRDGNPEATLLVRRPYEPWPIDEYLPIGGRTQNFQDDKGFSCHIILIGLVNGEFKEVWAGSAMADPVRKVFAADLDGDGRQEMAALEFHYDGSESKGSLVIWKWTGFSFSLVSRQNGPFSELNLAQGDDKTWVFTQ